MFAAPFAATSSTFRTSIGLTPSELAVFFLSPKRSFDGQVEVVRHDHERVQQPGAAFARLEQARFKCGFCSDVVENPRAIIPAIDHMVDRAGILHSQSKGHAHDGTGVNIRCQRRLYPKLG